MNRIALTRHPIAPKELLRKAAAEGDTDHVYETPGVYTLDGNPCIIYGRFSEPLPEAVWAVRSIGFQRESRSTAGGAIGSRGRAVLGGSRIFGFRPRIPFGANYCSVASAAQTHPAQHKAICNLGELVNSFYSTLAPETAAKHLLHLSGVRGEWILPGTRFTSGIVNQNNPLRYHYDKGNFPGVFSCMVVFRRLCEGGFLSIPEFNCRFLLDDQSYFLFDGQSILHGVTPIRKLNKNGYRYSVVFYALKAMAKCGSLDEEIARARAEKRLREKRRV